MHIERSGNDVVKLADELNVTKKAEGGGNTNGSSTNGTSEEKKEEPVKSSSAQPEEGKEPSEPQAGDKRKASEKADSEPTEQNGDKAVSPALVDDAKKLKTTNGKAAPAPTKEKTPTPAKEKSPAPAVEKAQVSEKKKPGRPKGGNNGGAKKEKKEKKVPAVGQAQRKTRSQGAAPEKAL